MSDFTREEIVQLQRDIQDVKVDLAAIKTMLSERQGGQEALQQQVTNLKDRVHTLQQFHAEARHLPAQVEELKRFMWKLSGCILFVAVVVESIILWMTRTPLPG